MFYKLTCKKQRATCNVMQRDAIRCSCNMQREQRVSIRHVARCTDVALHL